MKNLRGKNGIIFGSTGLLGNKITEELIKLDANLILQGTSKKKLKNLDHKMRSMKKKPILFHANALNKEFYEKLLEIVSSKFNKLDFLINLIGQFSGLKPLTHLSHHEWDQHVEINFSSYWRILKELEPLLRRSENSKIISVTNSKIAGGKAYHNTFSICKSGMNTIMEVFKKENKNLKIETYLVETDQLNDGMSSKISNKKTLNEKIFKNTVNRIVNYCK